ncbi:tumor necrosis factor ligand superfamily member 11 [Pseudophryne corroboree]|uniref:tumor necrosis factor ligand superfamily member 11 n=1 Tax=Pseudophryne corroboree TaxID=495146 RepID=UPI003081B81B
MSPGRYLRGAAELGGAPEIPDRLRTFPKSVLIALVLLALLQVGCTLGLFLYVKAQVNPSWMSEGEMQCWRAILKMRETPRSKDASSDDEGKLNLSDEMKLAFNAAVQKEVQGSISEKQPHTGNTVMEGSVLPSNNNHQTWPITHLTLGNNTADGPSIVHLKSWNNKLGWANEQNMSYNNGTLKVLQDGFYFVYANICFRHHRAARKLSQDALQLMLYVCKTNKSGRPPETLMKGGSTAIWSNNSVYNFYSVYQGGVFKLSIGEEIFIKASNAALLDPAQEATYFGAFKILPIHL